MKSTLKSESTLDISGVIYLFRTLSYNRTINWSIVPKRRCERRVRFKTSVTLYRILIESIQSNHFSNPLKLNMSERTQTLLRGKVNKLINALKCRPASTQAYILFYKAQCGETCPHTHEHTKQYVRESRPLTTFTYLWWEETGIHRLPIAQHTPIYLYIYIYNDGMLTKRGRKSSLFCRKSIKCNAQTTLTDDKQFDWKDE